MRALNFRPFLFIFVSIAVGLIFCLTAFYLMPLGVALLVVLLAGVAGISVRFFIGRQLFKAVTAALAFALIVTTAIVFFAVLENRFTLERDTEYYLTGRVTEHHAYEDGEFAGTLDELRANGRSVAGKLNLYISGADISLSQVECGYELSLRADVTYYEPIADGKVNAGSIRSDIRYYAYADGEDLDVVMPGVPYALESVRLGLREHLVSAMGEDAGAVAYGMTAGDRFLLPDDISDSFAKTGIGHILAVSGLHIGLIAFLVTRLLFLLPVPRVFGRAASTLALLSYVIFTGGSPSAVRAFVMCAVGIWAPAFGRPDPLNSLCLAGTVCLCISPYYLFECGFILSMSAVLGLVLFARPLTEFLQKLKLPKPVAGALSSAMAVQAAIIPATAYFFSRFYIYSLPVNAVMMGLLGLLFMFLVVCLPFSFFFAPLLLPCGAAVDGLIWICKSVAALPGASLTLQVSALIFVVLPLFFVASRFVMTKRKKLVSLVAVACCFAVGFAAENGIRADNALLAAGGSRTVTVIYDGDERYLIGDLSAADKVVTALDRARVCDDAFVIYTCTLDEENARGICKLAQEKRIKEVRFALSGNIGGLKTLIAAGIDATAVDRSDGKFDAAAIGGETRGWLYTSGGRTAYVSVGNRHEGVSAAADVIRCRYADDADENAVYLTSSRSDNAVVTDYGNSYLYDFTTGNLKKI